jgi:hypothetical protein
VTFNKDVLPLLQKNCQSCHRPGEVAPMSLMTYTDARPWAKALKTAVVARKMPPWFADPNVGHFANDRRLSDADINTLVAWVDGGAPEGDTKDKPAARTFEDGWNEARCDRRDAERLPGEGDRHDQLPVHSGEGELSGRHVGKVGRNAARQSGRCASHEGLGGSSRVALDGRRGFRRRL